MNIEQWIPVIVAVLTTVAAIFQALGKSKAQKITSVLIDQIEKWDEDDLKRRIANASEVAGVGNKLAKQVKKQTT